MKYLFGIKPTGNLHLGHLECLKEFNKEDVLILIADIHANVSNLNEKNYTYDIVKQFIFLGFKKENIVIQSMLKNLFDFSFFLSKFTNDSRIRRMHLYKKKKSEKQIIYASEYFYPILMCSDIFLLNINKVIIGKDQLQHLELYNYLYDRLPEEIKSFSSKVKPVYRNCIKGIDNRKMSKSYKNTISFFDQKEEIKKKINKIETKNISKNEKIQNSLLLDICYCIEDKEFKNTIKKNVEEKLGFKIIKDLLEKYIISKKVLEISFPFNKKEIKKQLIKNSNLINKRNKKVISIYKKLITN